MQWLSPPRKLGSPQWVSSERARHSSWNSAEEIVFTRASLASTSLTAHHRRCVAGHVVALEARDLVVSFAQASQRGSGGEPAGGDD